MGEILEETIKIKFICEDCGAENTIEDSKMTGYRGYCGLCGAEYESCFSMLNGYYLEKRGEGHVPSNEPGRSCK